MGVADIVSEFIDIIKDIKTTIERVINSLKNFTPQIREYIEIIVKFLTDTLQTLIDNPVAIELTYVFFLIAPLIKILTDLIYKI